jgi:uncharacterized membrane protein
MFGGTDMWGSVLESWSSIYANHATLRTVTEFLHVGGLMFAGGCAITADLASITAARENAAGQTAQLHLLKRTHVIVAVGLFALAVSGVLLLAADVATYWYSRVFWLKMGFIVLLLVNGAAIVRYERKVQQGETAAWRRLHQVAAASVVLWCLTTLAGVALLNIG